ncbi:MAG: DUF493 family protein [Cyclobacteriaceae bacterium]|nr:DUF493 family protein [Cyclobacteriaceae bacterium HetDA_MAG_MS6]
MSWNVAAFKEKIEDQHRFPGPYVFKFIVPKEKKDEVIALLPVGDLSFKASSGEKYISITLKSSLKSSDEVLEVYQKVHRIEGLIAL